MGIVPQTPPKVSRKPALFRDFACLLAGALSVFAFAPADFILWPDPAPSRAAAKDSLPAPILTCGCGPSESEVITPLQAGDPTHLVISPERGPRRISAALGEPIGQAFESLLEKPVALDGPSVRLLNAEKTGAVTPLNVRDPSALVLGPSSDVPASPRPATKAPAAALPQPKPAQDSGPFEQGLSRIAPGGLIGEAVDVITPLSVADPSALILTR